MVTFLVAKVVGKILQHHNLHIKIDDLISYRFDSVDPELPEISDIPSRKVKVPTVLELSLSDAEAELDL